MAPQAQTKKQRTITASPPQRPLPDSDYMVQDAINALRKKLFGEGGGTQQTTKPEANKPVQNFPDVKDIRLTTEQAKTLREFLAREIKDQNSIIDPKKLKGLIETLKIDGLTADFTHVASLFIQSENSATKQPYTIRQIILLDPKTGKNFTLDSNGLIKEADGSDRTHAMRDQGFEGLKIDRIRKSIIASIIANNPNKPADLEIPEDFSKKLILELTFDEAKDKRPKQDTVVRVFYGTEKQKTPLGEINFKAASTEITKITIDYDQIRKLTEAAKLPLPIKK